MFDLDSTRWNVNPASSGSIVCVIQSMCLKLWLQWSLMIVIVGTSAASVKLELEEPPITLGQPMKLGCKVEDKISGNVTRQWIGGKKNQLLCFNGVTIDPQKYTEISEQSKFVLTINELTEDDLDCPYSCRVGFETDQTILTVNESNFIQLPTNDTTNATYRLTQNAYRLDLEFKKVFPKPKCSVIIEERQIPLEIKAERTRVLYNVSLSLKSNETLHDCQKSEVEIHCLFGKEKIVHLMKSELPCKVKENQVLNRAYVIAIVVSAVILVSLTAVLFICLYKHKNIQYGSVLTTEKDASTVQTV